MKSAATAYLGASVFCRTASIQQKGGARSLEKEDRTWAADSIPCIHQVSYDVRTSLKSISMDDNPSGSKPTSPGLLPSKFFGCGMKGIDLLLAMLRELAGVRVARWTGSGAMKAEAPDRSAAKEAKVVFMVLMVGWELV